MTHCTTLCGSKFRRELLKFCFWKCKSRTSARMLIYVIKRIIFSQVLTIHAGYGTSMYAISGFFIWIRLLSFYRCSRKLGPLWIMLRKMMHEALGFMLIFSTISIAAGISMQVSSKLGSLQLSFFSFGKGETGICN